MSDFCSCRFVEEAENHSYIVGATHSYTPTNPQTQKTLLLQTPTNTYTTPTEKKTVNNRLILIYIILKINILYNKICHGAIPAGMRFVGV